MSGSLAIISPPFSNTCLRGVLNAREQLLYGIDAAVRIPAAFSFRLWPPKCESALFGICYPRSNREGG